VKKENLQAALEDLKLPLDGPKCTILLPSFFHVSFVPPHLVYIGKKLDLVMRFGSLEIHKHNESQLRSALTRLGLRTDGSSFLLLSFIDEMCRNET
jgi:hypothetical protein